MVMGAPAEILTEGHYVFLFLKYDVSSQIIQDVRERVTGFKGIQ
jgi:hypothetical protein